MTADFDSANERTTAVAAAKVQIGKLGQFIGQQSLQLHGGVGISMEAKIGHYCKCLTMVETHLTTPIVISAGSVRAGF